MSYIGDGSIYAYVPDHCRVDPSSATSSGSAGFRLDAWRSYFKSLIPSLTAGIVLGSIAACGFALFLLWLCVRHRRRQEISRARRAKREQQQAAKALQFIASNPNGLEAPPAAGPAGKQPGGCVPCMTRSRLLKWSIVLFALAVIGVSAWGLVESIISTQGLVDEFWALVDDVQGLVVDLGTSLSSLTVGLASLTNTLVSVQGLLKNIVDADHIPVLGPLIGKVIPLDTINSFLGEKGDAAVGAMEEAVVVLNSTIVPAINDTIVPTLDNIRANNEDWTTSLQDTWRYVVFAVLFGLLILVSAAVAWACFTMRRGMLATALVASLWALNMLVCLLGLGLMNGARTIADDACLYSEDLVTRIVTEKLEGDTQRIATSALDYYLGKIDLVDAQGNPLLTNGTTECTPELSAALLTQITGIQLHQAIIYAWDLADLLPTLTGLLDSLDLPTIPFVNFDLDSIKDPLVTASNQLTSVLDDVCNVTLLLLRENIIQPLYFRAKAYVCCDLSEAIYRVWVPWTVAAVLALVLSILTSVRIISSMLRPSGMLGWPSDDDPLPAQDKVNGGGIMFVVSTETGPAAGAVLDRKAGSIEPLQVGRAMYEH